MSALTCFSLSWILYFTKFWACIPFDESRFGLSGETKSGMCRFGLVCEAAAFGDDNDLGIFLFEATIVLNY